MGEERIWECYLLIDIGRAWRGVLSLLCMGKTMMNVAMDYVWVWMGKCMLSKGDFSVDDIMLMESLGVDSSVSFHFLQY